MKRIVGIDEVGRGAIAGPVSVGIVQSTKSDLQKVLHKAQKLGLVLRDSKQLSRRQREAWFLFLKQSRTEGLLQWIVVSVSAKQIDSIGINGAITIAIRRGIQQLSVVENTYIFLDGGLHAPQQHRYQQTIIKGDEIEPIISLASIVAKVTRDQYMTKQAKRYPNYALESNMGYGTKKHYTSIEQYGVLHIHRQTFL